MKYLKLTFSDIMQDKILYFDEDVVEACHNICDELRIDNMPSYDSKHYYERQDGVFKKYIIEDVQKVNANESIFKDELIEKFSVNKHNVLFVFDSNIIKGIVHFSDYNIEKVIQTIQDDVLKFEKNLRKLLYLKGFRNNDIINYLKIKLKKNYNEGLEFKINKLDENKDKMNSLGEFQMFYLFDLLLFSGSSTSGPAFVIKNRKINGVYKGINIINDLRNNVMHAKNPVALNENKVYSLNTLHDFFISLNALKEENALLEEIIFNNPVFQKSIKLDNENKLRIIKDHHPQAIDYFLRRG